ncbi:MSS51 [Candida oxycetoniae]|uniref:MSS51 n=1 Tax=Candida oxycetoniae TaxID=497107 RepID=A0AAI9T1L8_9ASCO|nr:MSS51 [Candida oxycetoniae]KAI3406957.2 MSS51 [Candida oxycetoniae]
MLAMDAPTKPKEQTVYNWHESPHEDLRTRAAVIRAKASCPVTSKPVNFVCPYSGIPTHATEEAWRNDTNYHSSKRYEILKQANIFEHQLREKKFDFVFPKEQEKEYAVNLSNWDTYFYTRDYPPMDDFVASMYTKLLTYPLTIGSILHQYSPYGKRELTFEGEKSLAALRYTLYGQKKNNAEFNLKEKIRIFVLGEDMIPGVSWKQMGFLFGDNLFDIHIIGDTNSPPVRYDDQINVYRHSYQHLIDGNLFPFDPYFDVFMLNQPGFNFNEVFWKTMVKCLLDSKCAVFVTGYDDKDISREMKWVEDNFNDDMDLLMKPIKNVFSCTKPEINDLNPTEPFHINSRIFGIRGKRYHAIKV